VRTVQTIFKSDCVRNAGGAVLLSHAFSVFGLLGMMSGLREYLLLDLRRDRSKREQEEEMGVGRNSSSERRKGESRESRFERVRVRDEGPAEQGVFGH